VVLSQTQAIQFSIALSLGIQQAIQVFIDAPISWVAVHKFKVGEQPENPYFKWPDTKRWILGLVAFALAYGSCICLNANVLHDLGYSSLPPWLSFFLSGLLIGSGTESANSILKLLGYAKQFAGTKALLGAPDPLQPGAPGTKAMPQDQVATNTHAIDSSADSKWLAMKEQPQEQTNWCWAATGASIANYIEKSDKWTQCNLATITFKTLGDCCDPANTDKCNRTAFGDIALENVHHYNGPIETLEWETITNEIGNGHPISVGITWNGGGAHNPVIDGYSGSDPGSGVIEVQDPWYGPTTIALSDFPGNYQGRATFNQGYLCS